MLLLLRFGRSSRLIDIVAIGAIFLAMAVDAAKAEKVNVLLMVKCYSGAGLVGRVVNFPVRYVDYGMGLAHDIGRIVIGVLYLFAIYRIMADETLRVVAPLTVTAQTLPVISPLKAWLTEVGGISLLMAFAAWRDMPPRAVMMACFTTFAHVRHVGVNLVIEMHSAIFIHQFVKEHRVRGLGQGMLRCLLGPVTGWAWLQAWIGSSRLLAGVALAAIQFAGPRGMIILCNRDHVG